MGSVYSTTYKAQRLCVCRVCVHAYVCVRFVHLLVVCYLVCPSVFCNWGVCMSNCVSVSALNCFMKEI